MEKGPKRLLSLGAGLSRQSASMELTQQEPAFQWPIRFEANDVVLRLETRFSVDAEHTAVLDAPPLGKHDLKADVKHDPGEYGEADEQRPRKPNRRQFLAPGLLDRHTPEHNANRRIRC